MFEKSQEMPTKAWKITQHAKIVIPMRRLSRYVNYKGIDQAADSSFVWSPKTNDKTDEKGNLFTWTISQIILIIEFILWNT